MPTYDYQCDACGHAFEEWQSFKDEPLTKCPGCKKNKLRRLMGGGAAVIFKGSGFYQTDYRSGSYESDAKADAPKTDAPKAETKAEPKADAKPSDSGGAAKKSDP